MQEVQKYIPIKYLCNIIEDYMQGTQQYWKDKKMQINNDIYLMLMEYKHNLSTIVYFKIDRDNKRTCTYRGCYLYCNTKWYLYNYSLFGGLDHVCKYACYRKINRLVLSYYFCKNYSMISGKYFDDKEMLVNREEIVKEGLTAKKYGFDYIKDNPKPYERYLDGNELNKLFY